MSQLVLIPGLICLILILRGRTRDALLSVYFPILLLLPEQYTIRLPHLPELSISEVCVIPLGAIALFELIRGGRLRPMDYLVASFVFSLSTTEVLYEHVTKDGIFIAVTAFVNMLLPYAVGRMMIEPHNRLPAVRRMVLLVLLLGIPGVFEWRMGRNFYGPIGSVFGAAIPAVTRLRGSHGRFAAAFLDAEMAGAAIAMVTALNAWLATVSKKQLHPGAERFWLWRQRYHLAGILLLAYIFFTQSRGPEIAVAAGYLILQITRFKKIKLGTAVVAVLLAAGAVAAYQYFDNLTNVADINDIHDEQQGSALYRRRMIELFQPIIEQGGWLGWGYKSFPHAHGLGNLDNGVQSIDNEFLYVALGQGHLGFLLFSLIAGESIRSLVLRSWSFAGQQDQAFAISMLAVMVILWISLATVYMGVQLPQFAFLLIGWSQSIAPGRSMQLPAPSPVASSRYLFRRVFT